MGAVLLLVLEASRLVFLANPKTATQSVRAMLRPRALSGEWQNDPNARHAGIAPFDRKWRKLVEERVGGPVEVFAVVRAPLARLDSWYRYRQRNPAGEARSTQGMGFEDFLRAVLSDPVPDFARVGAQDRFVGWTGARAGVDVLFDYDRLDLMMDFLADRVGQRLHLPQKNVSPVPRAALPEVAPDLLAALHSHMAGEFALHAAVAETGVLFADD
ncbi:gamma-glutamyl kinase [Gemmobacter straminiformis]|uniref:Gamma-glutamyl kinase n=1 Tax=Paragemmobacter straminiformis TaxID=2045119 RepID=A0A842I2D7_9RHOB|nr:gamma-glutamyl kinase [Gemmobacter straminiformis]